MVFLALSAFSAVIFVLESSPIMEAAWEIFLVFLKLGFTAFGGPAAHIGLFRQEVVQRRKWITDEQFLDLLGATNLIPGPNSTEMAIHVGFVRAGWLGLIAGGLAFTLPAMLMVLVLARLYVAYGATPQAGALLYAIKPVMIAVIVQALWMLGRKAIVEKPRLPGWLAGGICLGAIGLYFAGMNELLLLLLGGLLMTIMLNRGRLTRHTLLSLAPVFPLRLAMTAGMAAGALGLAATAAPHSLTVLFLTFLKIGSILYGSGYVLVAFLRADFVAHLGWLSEKQLIDAIAVGQVTPGPLFTSATFIGYLLGGLRGALLATLGIFLPSYIFVAISNPLIPRLRASPWTGGLLDGVIAASLGLMAAVSLQLARASLVDPLTLIVFGASLFLLLRFRTNATWLIAAAALIGLIKMILV